MPEKTGQSVQRSRLDEKIAALELTALATEEQAKYAETEAGLKKRIAAARKRIEATKPPNVLDGLLPSVTSKLPKGGARVLLVLVVLVVVILLIAKACS